MIQYIKHLESIILIPKSGKTNKKERSHFYPQLFHNYLKVFSKNLTLAFMKVLRQHIASES